MLSRLKSLTALFGVGVNMAGGALIVPLLSAKADPARTPTLTGVNMAPSMRAPRAHRASGAPRSLKGRDGLDYEQFVICSSLAKGGFLSGKSYATLGR